MNVRSDLCELQHTINSITQMQCVAYRSSPVSRLQQRQLRGPERLHRANVIARHAVQEDAIASHSQPSTCSSSSGTVTSSGCGKGSCGGGCSSSGGATLASLLGVGPAPQGVGSMNALMMSPGSVGISRKDIASAFEVQPSHHKGEGERVIDISELLASCPEDLVWEEEDEGLVV